MARKATAIAAVAAAASADTSTLQDIDSLPRPPEAKGGAVALREAEALAPVPSPDQIPIVEGLLVTFRDMIDTIEAHYSRLTKPFNTAIANARRMKAEDLAAWQRANTVAGMKLAAAREAVRRALAEAAAAKQRILDAQAKAEAEAKRQEELRILSELAKEAPTRKAQRELDQMAKDLDAEPLAVAPAAYVAPAAPAAMDALVERRDYYAEVHALGLLVAAVASGHTSVEALQPNQVWLNTKAGEARQEGNLYPGVRVVSKVVFVRRPLGGRN